MPEIARFYGIIIKIYFNDHNPPHFHAYYGEYDGAFDIQTLEMIYGDLPKKLKNLLESGQNNIVKKLWKCGKRKKLKNFLLYNLKK